ncbi:hypothetical protein GEMRC1_002976 [Eukaryota sp. GEM-RC1]
MDRNSPVLTCPHCNTSFNRSAADISSLKRKLARSQKAISKMSNHMQSTIESFHSQKKDIISFYEQQIKQIRQSHSDHTDQQILALELENKRLKELVCHWKHKYDHLYDSNRTSRSRPFIPPAPPSPESTSQSPTPSEDVQSMSSVLDAMEAYVPSALEKRKKKLKSSSRSESLESSFSSPSGKRESKIDVALRSLKKPIWMRARPPS